MKKNILLVVLLCSSIKSILSSPSRLTYGENTGLLTGAFVGAAATLPKAGEAAFVAAGILLLSKNSDMTRFQITKDFTYWSAKAVLIVATGACIGALAGQRMGRVVDHISQ